MSEKELENMLKSSVRKRGGVAFKFVSPGMTGVPDRLVVLPGGHVGFVEVKAPGKKPRAEQRYQIDRLQALGCSVHVLDDPNDIDDVINSIKGVIV